MLIERGDCLRTVCCVCYFLILFYGIELVIGDDTNETTPTNFVMTDKHQKPLKESIEDSAVCAYYPTYKMCTNLNSKQVTYFSIKLDGDH